MRLRHLHRLFTHSYRHRLSLERKFSIESYGKTQG